MALDMHIEASGDLKSWNIAKGILYEMGMPKLPEHRPNAIWGAIRDGAIFGEAELNRPSRRTSEIIAEGDHGCSFVVNVEISFRINNAMYDEAVAAIKEFLLDLSERTQMPFVLSFQYEGVYAVRDFVRGFEWFWDAPKEIDYD